MRLSESDGEYYYYMIYLTIMSLPCQHIADDISRQPNVDNISPIDKKAPMSMSRPGMATVCVLLESFEKYSRY